MKKHYLLAFVFLAFSVLVSTAQVEFGLKFDKSTDRYIVSLYPMDTYKLPYNLTATAQITIKAPAGRFFPTEIKGLYPGMDWEYNSRSNSPKEAPEFDYVSIALRNPGLIHLPYEKNMELPILSFRNEQGCSCPLSLVDNFSDPFMAPNSERVNIGNTIAVLGYGTDAFGGIHGDPVVDCQLSYTHDLSDEMISRFDLYPIPTERELFLEFDWAYDRQTVKAEIRDVLGRLKSVKVIDLAPGHNLHSFEVQNLTAGSYFLKLIGEDWDLTLDKFQKIKL